MAMLVDFWGLPFKRGCIMKKGGSTCSKGLRGDPSSYMGRRVKSKRMELWKSSVNRRVSDDNTWVKYD